MIAPKHLLWRWHGTVSVTGYTLALPFRKDSASAPNGFYNALLAKKGDRITEITALLEEKELRWLQLSEG